MADVNGEKTVIVDRDSDAVDRRSPMGLVILIVAIVVIALFFLLGGFSMFSGTGGSSQTQLRTPTTTTSPTPAR